MVRDDGTVKVTDFGIARALSSAPFTDHGQMIGTPAYLSPEQAVGDQETGASDMYSLSVVASEMFAGHAPFERDTPLGLALAHVNDPRPPLPSSVPARIAELIGYDTGSAVVDETDEITLARHPDGQLVITAQRTV